MKKTLLLVALLTFSLTIFCQKVWNLGGDASLSATPWALSTGIGNGSGTEGNPAFPVIVDGLSITGITGNINMGAVTASSKTFTDSNSKSYTFPNRFQFNGGGYSGASVDHLEPTTFMPTQRYISFDVSGNSEIYVIGITGSSSATRRLFVTDGTKLIGTVIFAAGSNAFDGTVTYTGPATTLYLFCNQACNLMLLSTTNYVASSINQVNSNKTIVSEKFFDILGREVSNKSKGLIIKRQVYDDGTIATLKTLVRKEK